MAKKDLAKLAALGALGYMLTRGKSDTSTTDTGDETERLANRGGSRRQITDYMAKAPAEPREAGIAAANDVRAPATAGRLPPAALTDNTTGIDTSTTVYPGGLEKRAEGNQPMPSLQAVEAKIATPKYQASTDAMKNVSNAINREDKTKKAAQRDFPDYKRTFKNPEKEKLNARIEEQTGANTSSAHKTDALKVASRAAAAADAARRKAKQAAVEAGMKKGGKVKKMASGGMTASRRADGIASKGKTKCKMY